MTNFLFKYHKIFKVIFFWFYFLSIVITSTVWVYHEKGNHDWFGSTIFGLSVYLIFNVMIGLFPQTMIEIRLSGFNVDWDKLNKSLRKHWFFYTILFFINRKMCTETLKNEFKYEKI